MITGSEVHIDIFDDRMEIYSPGGMMDGSLVQDLNTDTVPSKRRNPVIADVFSRMNYMERRGGGFKKIKADYHRAVNFREALEPQFYSDRTNFIVTLFNLNYGVEVGKTGKQENRKTGSQKGAVPQWIRVLPYKQPTLEKIYLLYERYGTETAFNRSDVMQATGLTGSPASALLTKMRKADLLERLNGALHHAVVRLGGRQPLQGLARRGERGRQPVVVRAGPVDDLIGKAHDDRQQRNARGHADERIAPAQK